MSCADRRSWPAGRAVAEWLVQQARLSSIPEVSARHLEEASLCINFDVGCLHWLTCLMPHIGSPCTKAANHMLTTYPAGTHTPCSSWSSCRTRASGRTWHSQNSRCDGRPPRQWPKWWGLTVAPQAAGLSAGACTHAAVLLLVTSAAKPPGDPGGERHESQLKGTQL